MVVQTDVRTTIIAMLERPECMQCARYKISLQFDKHILHCEDKTEGEKKIQRLAEIKMKMEARSVTFCLLSLLIIAASTSDNLVDIRNHFLSLNDFASTVSVQTYTIMEANISTDMPVLVHLLQYTLSDAIKFQAMCTVLRQVRSNQCNETDSLDRIRNVTCSYVLGMSVSGRE